MAPASDAIFTPIVAAPAAPAKVNFIALAWLAGAGIVLAAGGIGYHINLRRIRTNATSPDRLLQLTLAETALEAGLKRAPRTVISPAIASPAVTGFVRPVLLLPAGFPEGFSPAEARLILLHEFTHLKRLDLPLNWLMCVLQAMHWFNPLLWFAFARMRADRELACDARVLSIDASDRRAEYGGALLKLQCVTPTRALSLGFVGIFERGSEIKSRIREISTHRRTRLARQIAGGVIVTLLMIFGVTKAQPDSPPADAPSSVKEDPARAVIPNKLNTIIIPTIDFEDVSVEEAIDFLRFRAAQLDAAEKDPDKRGINFVIRNPRDAAAAPMIRELRLRNVSLGAALKEICEQANLSYAVDENAIVISPKNEGDAEPAVPADAAKTAVIQNKLKSITIPRVDFHETSLEEAIDFLRLRAVELDAEEKDPARKGINIVIRQQAPAGEEAAAEVKIGDLRLRNVPLGMALRMICEQTGFQYTVDDFAVILSPQDETGAEAAKPAIDQNPRKGELQAVVRIGGQVRRPGPVPFIKGLTIYQAIQAAGGPTEIGSMRRVKITRMGETVHDLTSAEQRSVLVRENDTIEVPEKTIPGD